MKTEGPPLPRICRYAHCPQFSRSGARMGSLGRHDGRDDRLHPAAPTGNVPYMDDFAALVSVMTGHEPVSLRWVCCQRST